MKTSIRNIKLIYIVKLLKLFECIIALKDRHFDADYKSDEIFASVLSMLVLYKPE